MSGSVGGVSGKDNIPVENAENQAARQQRLTMLQQLVKIRTQVEVFGLVVNAAKSAQTKSRKAQVANVKGIASPNKNDPGGLMKTHLQNLQSLLQFVEQNLPANKQVSSQMAKLGSKVEDVRNYYNKNEGAITNKMKNDLDDAVDGLFNVGAKNLQKNPRAYQQFLKKGIKTFGAMKEQSNAIAARQSEPGLGASSPQYGGLGAQAGNAGDDMQAKLGAQESLPQQFVDILLGKYMPSKESDLEFIANLLEIGNGGVQFANQLMSDMSSYQNPSTDFNFNNFMGSHAGTFPNFTGSSSNAQAQIAAEQEAIDKDIGEGKAGLSDAEAKMKQLEQDIKNSSGQAQAAYQSQYDTAKNLVSNIKEALKNLQTIKGQFQDLKAIPTYDKKGNETGYTFAYVKNGVTTPVSKDFQSQIQTSENLVCNGDSKSTPAGFGGLSHIYSLAQGLNNKNSSLSQTLTLQVQMDMTMLQTGWSTCASAMQQLHQDYMTPAQNIK